jgi:plasmid stability protein
MTNVTLNLEEDLLRRARSKAVEQGTSLNVVVREFLTGYVGPSEAEIGVAMLTELANRSVFTVGEQGITWTREDLHERANLR